MRPYPLLAITCVLALLCMAGVAQAATTTLTFQGSISPATAGTKKAPKNVTLKASAAVQNNDGSQPPQATNIVLGLDRNIGVDSKDFVVKGCTVNQLNNSKNIDDPKCKKAKIGSATAIAKIDTSPLTFDTRLYANDSSSIIVVVKQTAGIGCCGVYAAFKSPIIALSKPYGKGLNIAIHQSLLMPLPGLYPSLVALNDVKIGATKRVSKRVKVNGKFRTKQVTVRFLSSVGCTNSKFNLRALFKFHSTPTVPSPGPDLTKDTFSGCR